MAGACDAAPSTRARNPRSRAGLDAAVTSDSQVSSMPDSGSQNPDARYPDAQTPVDASFDRDAGPMPSDAGEQLDAGTIAMDASSTPTGRPRFAFPIHADDRAEINTRTVFGVDHDPVVYGGLNRYICRNYADLGFPRCYDEHRGSDYPLTNGFTAMDSGSARVLAAAGGIVESVEDGNYDRCHADIATSDVSCDGHPMRANFVVLRHFGQWRSRYLHFKQSSILVQVGDRVSCGTELGLVGSSGYSSAPHLHFEVRDPQDQVWDPYAGVLSQSESLWTNQDAGDGLPENQCHPQWTSAP
jgi:murein DD-endopeptidase MepM/ murein hydrolase activator NlpD